MANAQEINDLFQKYRGRDANPDELTRYGAVDFDTLQRSLGQSWDGQRDFVRNIFLEKLGREPNERDYAVYATAPPDRVVDDVLRSPEHLQRQINENVQDLTKDQYLQKTRDQFAKLLDEQKYNDLRAELEEEYTFANDADKQAIANQLADLERNRTYYNEDTNTNLSRLDRAEGYATQDYSTNVAQQQFQNTLSRRNREGALNRRGVYEGGIADTLRRESEQQLQQPLSGMQRAYQRRLEGYGDQRSDTQKGLSRYNTNYDTQKARIQDQRDKANISRERSLKKQRRSLTNQRDQELGTTLTNKYQEYLGSKSF